MAANELLWNHTNSVRQNLFLIWVLQLPKLGEARQKNIFSSEKFLKQADLHGDPLYFEAISVLNDIESAASKWFTDRLLSWI
jgi:hypothetical protein